MDSKISEVDLRKKEHMALGMIFFFPWYLIDPVKGTMVIF